MRSFFPIHIGVLLMALHAMPVAFTASLTDIAEDTNRTAIEYLREQGIIEGYADGTFRPQQPINRAELLKILIESVGLQLPATGYHDCFMDVNEEWFAGYVCYAKEQGWISGYEDGFFRPNQTVNTAEAIKMIVNAYGYTLMQSSSAAPFDDVNISAWYAPYVSLAHSAGILDATGGRLGIAEHISRGRISGMIERSMRSRNAGNAPQTAARPAAGVTDRIRAMLGHTVRRGGGGSGNRTESGGASSSTRILPSPTLSLDDLSKTYGDGAFAVTATSNSAGDITYASSDTDIATVAGSTITIVSAGTVTITATQEADGDYTSGSTTATLTIDKSDSATILTSSTGATQYGTSVLLRATVTSGATGTVSFYTGAVLLGTGAITNGSGSLTTTTLKRGTGSLTAAYAGDDNFNGSTSDALLQRIYRNQCLIPISCLNGGTCSNVGDGFSCACVPPYAGVRCELAYDFCTEEYGGTNCFNGGVCVPSTARGECDCADCYSGTFCDVYNPDECA